MSYFSLCWSSMVEIKPSAGPRRGSFITKHVNCSFFIVFFKLAYVSQLHRKLIPLQSSCSDCALRGFVILWGSFSIGLSALVMHHLKKLIIRTFYVHDCCLTFNGFWEFDARAVQRSEFRKMDIKRYHPLKSPAASYLTKILNSWMVSDWTIKFFRFVICLEMKKFYPFGTRSKTCSYAARLKAYILISHSQKLGSLVNITK